MLCSTPSGFDTQPFGPPYSSFFRQNYLIPKILAQYAYEPSYIDSSVEATANDSVTNDAIDQQSLVNCRRDDVAVLVGWNGLETVPPDAKPHDL